MRRIDHWQVQFITHANERFGYVEGAKMALDGGCRWIQLRTKAPGHEVEPAEYVELAHTINALCQRYDATFVLDDNVEVVKKLKIAGVHLGLSDMPVAEARQQLGSETIIGGTANTLEHIVQHVANGVDYVGCGPFRFTSTKQKLASTLGLEGYRSIVEQMRQRQIDIPMVAIGGIVLGDLESLKQVGIQGVAVSGCVLNAENPVDYMKQLVETMCK